MPISFDRNVLTEFFWEPCFEFGGLGWGLAGAGLVGQSSKRIGVMTDITGVTVCADEHVWSWRR